MTLLFDPTTKNLIESSVQSAPKYGLLVPNRLFVGGLGAEITEEDLRSFFATYGPIKHCKILSDANGMSKGYGFVTFVSTEDVEKLLKKEGEQVVYKDRKLNIGPAVRKQGALPQVLGNTQNAVAAVMAAGQGGIIYANGMPCMVQGGSAPVLPINHGATILPLQDGLSAYPQLMSLPTGGVQMMMVHPQYLAHHGALLHAGGSSASAQQAALSRSSIQLGGALQLDPATGLSQILAQSVGASPPTLVQGLGQQPVFLSAPSMTSSNSVSGLEQYLYQLPCMIPHHQSQQHQALLHQHLQSGDILSQSLTGVELLQQKIQQQKQQHFTLTEQGLSSPLQYFELPLSQSQSGTSSSGSPPSHHQSISTAKSSETSPSMTSESKGAGIKRVLNIPYQTVCSPTYAGSVYGLPAVKILAGQGQQRIVTQALDPSDIQVLAKNLK